MLCAVYKSLKKEETYLFVAKRDDFSAVPDALLSTFGKPELVTVIDLSARDKLGFSDIEKVKTEVKDIGFYLQLPPPKEDLLKQHRASQKKEG